MTLDTSVSIPLLLTRSDSHEYLDHFGNNETPGKFYKTEAALTLVGNVCATGASAVVDVAENASSDQKKHFSRFFLRLDSGDLVSALMFSFTVLITNKAVSLWLYPAHKSLCSVRATILCSLKNCAFRLTLPVNLQKYSCLKWRFRISQDMPMQRSTRMTHGGMILSQLQVETLLY